jgi:hypothetical protein
MRLYGITPTDVLRVVAAPNLTGADDDPDFVITTFPDD